MLLPFINKHTVDHHIYVPTVQELGLTHDAFLRETQTFRHGAAALVAACAMNLDPVQTVVRKGIGGHGATGSGDDTLTLHGGIQPVADLRFVIVLVDVIQAKCADKLALIRHPGLQTSPFRELAYSLLDEGLNAIQRYLTGPGSPARWMRLFAL